MTTNSSIQIIYSPQTSLVQRDGGRIQTTPLIARAAETILEIGSFYSLFDLKEN